MLKSRTKEKIATAVVHSLLILLIGGAIGYIFSVYGPLEIQKQPVLGTAANCPGTKLNYPRTVRETIRGKRVSFKYNCIQSGFLSTSYDGNCKGCSGRTHFTNEPVTWGICAVDPDVIRPHSWFYVPGYGPCKAADTGGAVKGKKIDLGFDDVRNGWWSRRYTDIYTLVR
jgi:3D (Asp-Asp-Asp) domain-containing protein